MRIVMIRHAPVVDQQGKIYGDQVAIDLESQGDRINEIITVLPPVAAADWYHSGVDRTVQTAAALSRAMGAEIAFEKNAMFREQDFGHLIGQTHAEAAAHIRWIDDVMLVENPPGGESVGEFIQRVITGLVAVIKAARGAGKSDIVIVTHRGVIRAADIYFNGWSPDRFGYSQIDPLGVRLFEVQYIA